MKTCLLLSLIALASACTSQEEDVSQRETERMQEERFYYQEQQSPRIR